MGTGRNRKEGKDNFCGHNLLKAFPLAYLSAGTDRYKSNGPHASHCCRVEVFCALNTVFLRFSIMD